MSLTIWTLFMAAKNITGSQTMGQEHMLHIKCICHI